MASGIGTILHVIKLRIPFTNYYYGTGEPDGMSSKGIDVDTSGGSVSCVSLNCRSSWQA